MKQNMNPVLVMTLLPCLCSATKQHCNGCLKKKFRKYVCDVNDTRKKQTEVLLNNLQDIVPRLTAMIHTFLK